MNLSQDNLRIWVYQSISLGRIDCSDGDIMIDVGDDATDDVPVDEPVEDRRG